MKTENIASIRWNDCLTLRKGFLTSLKEEKHFYLKTVKQKFLQECLKIRADILKLAERFLRLNACGIIL